MSKKEKVDEIKRKSAKIEEEDKGMVQYNIRIVKFRNLSPWLKTIVVFSWVIALYTAIFFSIGFYTGIVGII